MKKTFLFGMLLAVTLPLCSQISKTPVAPVNQSTNLVNFLGKNAPRYTGNKLYLRELPTEDRDAGYAGFLLDHTKPRSPENTYKYTQMDFYENRSNYADLADRYFMVEDVIQNDSIRDIFYLKLREQESKDIVYYEYNAKDSYTFPFLSIAYADNAKKMYVGESYILRGKNWLDYCEDVFDINSGNPVDYSAGTEWICIDVSITGKYYELSLILKNKADEKIFMPVYILPDNEFMLNSKKAQQYEAKFGEKAWQDILSEKTEGGFTKEMVSVSLGSPENIKNTPLGEQWEYSDEYIYFVNGRVKNSLKKNMTPENPADISLRTF